jgi:seryl-tRNA synthetase
MEGADMTKTTKEAERFARWCDTDGFTERATALRSLAAERDALQAERDDLAKRLKDVERERNHQHGRADRNANLHAVEQKKREQLQAENARLREALRAFPGFVDDATIGDVWIERKNAALGGEGNE